MITIRQVSPGLFGVGMGSAAVDEPPKVLNVTRASLLIIEVSVVIIPVLTTINLFTPPV